MKKTMTEKQTYPWIIMDASDDKKGFKCTRCHNSHTFEMPISISEFNRLAMAFIELHKNCKEKIKS